MASITKIFCFILVFVLCCDWSVAEKVMRPHFKDSKFWSDNKYISHTVTYDEGDPHINITVNVLKELHNLDLHIETKFVQKQDPTYMTTTNSTINFCRLIDWRNKSPIGTVIYDYLKGYGNLVEKCPIVKGKYFVHSFWYPEDDTFANSPGFDFEIDIIGYHLDANMKRDLVMEDHIKGETSVKDVNKVKAGLLGLLSRKQ